MVVFGDREPLPSIVSDYRRERAADETIEGLVVPVVVVAFEVDARARLPKINDGETVGSDDELVKLIASIDRRLALLSAREERELRRALTTDILKTESRIAMFDGIDSARGSGELGKLGGVGERSAQLFVKELLELGLVCEVPNVGGRR